MNFKLTILGSASGLPEPDRAHAALALHNQGEIYLLDAGEGAASALLRWDLDPLDVKSIFITHTHPDHCVGIFMILQYMHVKEYRGLVDIYLPSSVLHPFQEFMNQLYLVRGEINPDYQLLPLSDRHPLADDYILETFPTEHLKRWRELDLPGVGSQAYSFRVSRPGGHSLFYSGDIAAFSDVAAHVTGKDLLVLEGAHIDVDEVIDWALESGMRRIVFTHVLPEAEWVESEQVETARKRGLEIILANDGQELSF